MTAPETEQMNTSASGDETHILGSHELKDVGNAANSSSARITSEEAARQIKAAIDPLTRQLEKLCDLVQELYQNSPKRCEETSSLPEGPSRSHANKSDMVTGPPLYPHSY